MCNSYQSTSLCTWAKHDTYTSVANPEIKPIHEVGESLKKHCHLSKITEHLHWTKPGGQCQLINVYTTYPPPPTPPPWYMHYLHYKWNMLHGLPIYSVRCTLRHRNKCTFMPCCPSLYWVSQGRHLTVPDIIYLKLESSRWYAWPGGWILCHEDMTVALSLPWKANMKHTYDRDVEYGLWQKLSKRWCVPGNGRTTSVEKCQPEPCLTLC